MKTMDTLMRAVRFMKKLVAGQASSELEDDDVTVDAVTFYKCNSCLKDIPVNSYLRSKAIKHSALFRLF